LRLGLARVSHRINMRNCNARGDRSKLFQ
jgi:hypothetical protein